MDGCNCDNCLRDEDDGLEIHHMCQECVDDSEDLDRQAQIALLKRIRRLLPKASTDCQRARRYITKALVDLEKKG